MLQESIAKLFDNERQQIPGLAFSVVDIETDQCDIFTYGFSSILNKSSIQSDQLLEIGSITKSMTAFVCFKVLHDNNIDPFDSIGKHLPQNVVNRTISDLTFVELLSHTSGLPLLQKLFIDVQHEEEFYQDINNSSISNKGKYLYTNYGPILVGLSLKHLTGLNIQNLLKKYIFEPANMEQTLNLDHLDTRNFCASYRNFPIDNTEWLIDDYWNQSLVFCCAGVVCSIEDINKYMKFLFQDMNSALLKNICQVITDVPSEEFSVCCGLYQLKYSPENFFHIGCTGRFTTLFSLNLNKKRGMFVMTNSKYKLKFVKDLRNIAIKSWENPNI